MIKKRLVLFCAAILALGWVSCNSTGDHNPMAYDRQKVAEVIAAHDTTILYFMTSWCGAGQSDFERNLKPYLSKASDTKAIVIGCVGELEEVMRLDGLNDNLFLFNKVSRGGFIDRLFINNECKKLLRDYKRVNYVPVRLVCNGKGEILNWNADKESSSVYGLLYPYLIGWK